METARPFAPETRSRDRLWFGFRPDKPGKRPGFTDSTGEYRDTRTGWLGREDSNLRMPESKSGALPLGYAPKPQVGSALIRNNNPPGQADIWERGAGFSADLTAR